MKKRSPTFGFISFFVKHPNAANLLMILMIIAGIFGAMRMNTQFFPTFDRPNINITISWPGASAEDVVTNILEVAEPEVRFTDGLEKLEAYARQGSGSLLLEFSADTDMQKAVSDVEQAIDSITTFPQDAEDPSINRSVYYDKVANISISGPVREQVLKQFAGRIRDDLLNEGIDRVTFSGYREEEIWVEVDPDQLRRTELTISDVSRSVTAATQDLPSGSLEGVVERQIRALSESRSPQEISEISVRALSSGEKIKVKDIAEVSQQFDRDTPIVFSNGNPLIELIVYRTATTDTLESAKIVRDYIAEVVPTFPSSISVELLDIRAERVQQRISLLLNNGLTGLALVLVVLFIFLNARVAFWVAVGIPVAMMMTLAIMWMSGQTINMISLFALILTLGIIVDDAIVVGEQTATLTSQGVPPPEAAERGAMRMFIPVTAAIITTQLAFLPITFIRDTIGQIMGAMPLVVIAVLTASLLESFLILPAHLSHGVGNVKKQSRFRQRFDAGFAWFRDNIFRFFVKLTFDWRYTTIAMSITVLWISIGLFEGGRVKFRFFPSPEPESITAAVTLAPGLPRPQAIEIMTQFEQSLYKSLEKFEDKDETLVRSVFSVLGKSGRTQNDNLGEVKVQLTASEERSVLTREIVKSWREAVPKIPGVDRYAISASRLGPPGRDLEILLQGASAETLKQAAGDLRKVLAEYPGVSGVADDLPYGKPETILELNSRGEALGFTIDEIGRQIRNAFQGAIARRFAEGDEEITVRVLQNEEARNSQALQEFYLRSPQGRFVPLTEVVDFREKTGFSFIQRRNGSTTIAVTANVDSKVVTNQELVAALEEGAIREVTRKYGINYSYSGKEEERRKAFADLNNGLIIALTSIYLILALVFGHYFRPLAVMGIIPFGIIGAIVGHYIMDFPLTILSLMGLLGLSGILVNDSIILVSRIVERRDWGETLAEAAVNGSCDRFRAVLLTSLTTIGGLIPLLFEKSLQAQFLLPIAITLVFGLAFATVIVLFIVPALLGIGDDIARMAITAYRTIDYKPARRGQEPGE